ncbi:MAG: transporter substrate-binding domain-containing protein [Chthoniobacterales bacterium]|nr:transporter substrate-binding domain-containing protein [Chthoniobacterales bacterium]
MNFSKGSSPLLVWLLALLFFTSCHRSGENQQQVLKVGMDLSYPPFEMINERGEPDGISVEMARALSQFLHRPLKIENISYAGLLPSLKTGKIDLIISSMSDTPERRKSIAFSDPYLKIGLGALMQKNAPIHTIEDLDHPGIKVAVRQATAGQVWAQAHLKEATIVAFNTESAAVLEVMQKKVDAFLYDQLSVWREYHEHPQETRPLLFTLQEETCAIAIPLSNPELREQVNCFLKRFREEKGFEQLGNRYLQEQKEDFAKQGIPFVF